MECKDVSVRDVLFVPMLSGRESLPWPQNDDKKGRRLETQFVRGMPVVILYEFITNLHSKLFQEGSSLSVVGTLQISNSLCELVKLAKLHLKKIYYWHLFLYCSHIFTSACMSMPNFIHGGPVQMCYKFVPRMHLQSFHGTRALQKQLRHPESVLSIQ